LPTTSAVRPGRNYNHVGLDDLDVRLVAKLKAQFSRERSVDLDCDQASAAAREDRRNRPVTRADLNHGAFAEAAESIDNCVPGSIVDQEILSEFGLVRHLSLA
jgi:molecular chaperone DnaK (HSP70)